MNSDSRYSRRFLFSALLLGVYLIALFLFVFFPRPVLESNSTTSITEYLQTHANLFYKILYANDRAVAIAILFGLFPPLMVWIGRHVKKYRPAPQMPGGRIFFSVLILFVVVELALQIAQEFLK